MRMWDIYLSYVILFMLLSAAPVRVIAGVLSQFKRGMRENCATGYILGILLVGILGWLLLLCGAI